MSAHLRRRLAGSVDRLGLPGAQLAVVVDLRARHRPRTGAMRRPVDGLGDRYPARGDVVEQLVRGVVRPRERHRILRLLRTAPRRPPWSALAPAALARAMTFSDQHPHAAGPRGPRPRASSASRSADRERRRAPHAPRRARRSDPAGRHAARRSWRARPVRSSGWSRRSRSLHATDKRQEARSGPRSATWRCSATTRSRTWAAGSRSPARCWTTTAPAWCSPSINGRQETRVYAKPVTAGTSSYNLSTEEQEAIRQALAAPAQEAVEAR